MAGRHHRRRPREPAPDRPLIAEQIQAARAEAEAAEVALTFQAIGSTAWAKLLAEHPPAKGRPGSFNPETFPPAAIAATLIDPSGFTVDKVIRLLDGLNDGAFQRLWGHACGSTSGTVVSQNSGRSSS